MSEHSLSFHTASGPTIANVPLLSKQGSFCCYYQLKMWQLILRSWQTVAGAVNKNSTRIKQLLKKNLYSCGLAPPCVTSCFPFTFTFWCTEVWACVCVFCSFFCIGISSNTLHTEQWQSGRAEAKLERRVT